MPGSIPMDPAIHRKVWPEMYKDTPMPEPDENIDYKPLPVAGYTEQNKEKVDFVNENKYVEEEILRRLDGMMISRIGDPRWTAIARTYFEQAFMAMNRAVFQPQRIAELPKDRPDPLGR